MTGAITSLITGTGSYLPQKVLTNNDLADVMETSDEWIRKRTGIGQRHVAGDDEKTSDLAVEASRQAIANAGLNVEDIDAIVIATTTPDDTFPSTAATVQAKLGAINAFAFDVQAVCAGFVYALDVADALIKSHKAQKVLVIGAETFTRILDWEDRTTAVLFGDGAGAVVLEASTDTPEWGILSSCLFTDGRFRDLLYVDGGVSSTGDVGHVRMKGNEVFRHAVEKLSSSLDSALKSAGLSDADIDWLVPHQANVRIIDSMQKKLGMPTEKVVRTVAQHANTSAASIPLALNAAVGDGRIQPGHIIAFEAIGGGLTWGAALARFGRP